MNHLRIVLLVSLVPLLPVSAAAQDRTEPPLATHRIELFVGYEGRSDLGDRTAYLSMSGRNHTLRVSVDWNLTDRVALVFGDPEFGVGRGEPFGTRINSSFLVGPRIRWPSTGRLMPFAHVLCGVAHGDLVRDSLTASSIQPAARERRTEFQTAVGGGVDVRLNSRFAWRALQVEERSLFGGPEGDHRLAFSSGIVIRFSARK